MNIRVKGVGLKGGCQVECVIWGSGTAPDGSQIGIEGCLKNRDSNFEGCDF